MATTTAVNLYEPNDVDEAHAEWKCNCGPAALAAVLRVPCQSVRPLFPLFPGRAWCNPTDMQIALGLTRAVWKKCRPPAAPTYGLCFLQITGPWTQPGVPVAAAYRHTHWVGVAQQPACRMVYDVNGGQWTPRPWWETNILAEIIKATPRATGWRLRAAIEVQP